MSRVVHETSSPEKSFSRGSIAEMGIRLLRAALVMAVLVGFCQAVFADVVEQGVKDSKPSGLLAGVAKANIDPATGSPMGGWGSASHYVNIGVAPAGMYIRALVLSDGIQKFALVDIDGGLDDVAAVKRASDKTGIPVEHIRVGSCHTHSAPSIRRPLLQHLLSAENPDKAWVEAETAYYEAMLERYQEHVADMFVGAVIEANSKLRPVHAAGLTGIGSININRRFRIKGDKAPWPAVGFNPEGFVDRELPVIRIDDAQGNPYVVMVNFQAHGTLLSYLNKYASPDWIGPMRNTVEASVPGATCIFFQGACGNLTHKEGYTGDMEVAERLGRILGLEAAAVAWDTFTVRREVRFEGYIESSALQADQRHRVVGPYDATLKYAGKVIELPRRVYTKEDIDRMAKLTADAENHLADVKKAPGSKQWDINQATARLSRWSNLLNRYKRPADTAPVKLEITALRIGDMALLMTQGEIFAELGAAVKKGSPFAVTMFCGYGEAGRVGGGYMPNKEEYPLGSYEVDGTPYAQGAGETMVEQAIALLKSVR